MPHRNRRGLRKCYSTRLQTRVCALFSIALLLLIGNRAQSSASGREIETNNAFEFQVPDGLGLPDRLKFELAFQTGAKCGPNAVYALLRLSGISCTYDEVAAKIPVGPEGADLEAMATAANDIGLEVEIRKRIIPDDLINSPMPMILHLKASALDSSPTARDHFTVLSSVIAGRGQVGFNGIDTTNLRFTTYPLAHLARSMSGYGIIIKGFRVKASSWVQAAEIVVGSLAAVAVALDVALGFALLRRD